MNEPTPEQLKGQLEFYAKLASHQSNEIGRLSTEIIKANMTVENLTAQLTKNEKKEGGAK